MKKDQTRTYFKRENDFNDWLSQHLHYLNEPLAMSLTLHSREFRLSNGKRVDIACKDSEGNTVFIESQLTPSDDNHFARIQHYGHLGKANAVVWLTRKVNLSYLEILEKHNSQGYNYYIIEFNVVDSENVTFNLKLNPFPPEAKEEDKTNYRLWCVYPARNEDTYRLFTQDNMISLNFGGLPDLKAVPDEISAFKDLWALHNPVSSDGQIRSFAPIFHSFCHRAKVNDYIIYPITWRQPIIFFGKIVSNYMYKKNWWLIGKHPHRRYVQWLKELDRESFSKEALSGIKVNLAFFQVRNQAFKQELKEKMDLS